jgi:hypothetical protein
MYPSYFDPNSTTTVFVSSMSTSPISSNPVGRWGNQNDYFIGDFIGLVANTSGFIPYWSDTRQSSSGLATAKIITSFLGVQTQACSLILDRSTYGEDEVTAMLVGGAATFLDAVYVVVDGLAPAQLGLTTAILPNPPLSLLPTLGGSLFDNSGVTLAFDSSSTTGGVQLEVPTNLNAVQRITFPFNMVFSIPTESQTLQAFNGLNASGLSEFGYELSASVTTVATASSTAQTIRSSLAEIEFVTQADPYMQSGQTWWLSNDMRVFAVTPATLGAMQAPLQYSTTLYGSNPNDYIAALLDELNTNFTDPTNLNTPFNAIPAGEDQSALMLSQNDTNGNPVFNFGLARLHLQGDMASNVRTFFRLFISSSPDTDFDSTTTFRSLPQTNSSGNILGTLIPLLGFPTTDMTSTIPFFAAPRIDSTVDSMTTQSDASNVQAIPSPTIPNPPAPSSEVYAYFGCWLDINQPTAQFPLNPSAASTQNGPWMPSEILPIPAIIMGNHACLVAEVSYDPDPIAAGANAATSDKIGQRNLFWSGSDNPGPADAHRVPTLFDIRPTIATSPISALPDELMIEWGNTPIGSRATIYWPAVNADHVLELANRFYGARRLTKIDNDTIQCISGSVTYIPIPPGTGPKLAGLLTLDLPQTVRTGEEFNVLVRRLSSRSIGKSANVTDARKWRYVVGAFQIRIPVSTSSALLPTEESILAVYKWKIEQIPAGNRWLPVLKRYIQQVSGRVNGFGGNAGSVQSSQTGGATIVPTRGKLCEYTGKVTGIIFDRFGDFEGFLLRTEAGNEMSFAAREREIEERVREAWMDRMVISVFVESCDPRCPVLIILRRAPEPGGWRG